MQKQVCEGKKRPSVEAAYSKPLVENTDIFI